MSKCYRSGYNRPLGNPLDLKIHACVAEFFPRHSKWLNFEDLFDSRLTNNSPMAFLVDLLREKKGQCPDHSYVVSKLCSTEMAQVAFKNYYYCNYNDRRQLEKSGIFVNFFSHPTFGARHFIENEHN